MMNNGEKVPNPEENPNPEADRESKLSPELIDKIKHPPRIDDVLRELPPEEIRGNQAVVPEMLDEPSDEIIGFTRD